MPIEKNDRDSIFLNPSPMLDIKGLTDKQVLEQLERALSKDWNVYTHYGNDDNYYNALHACAVHGKVDSCLWLLEKGLDPNLASGNDSRAFTFMLDALNDNEVGLEKFLYFTKKLKEYGGDLSLSGYDKKSPLSLYAKYNNKLHNEVIDLLIDNSNFEKGFELNTIIIEQQYLNFRVLKKIISTHKVNLKEFSPASEDNSSESYWDMIAIYFKGKHAKKEFVFVEWLHKKIGFDLEQIHTSNMSSYSNKEIYTFNLLGMAIHNKNKAMFEWVLKQKPHFINTKFSLNDKQYDLLEFSVMCNFRYGVQLALRNMDKNNLLSLEFNKLKDLSKNSPRMTETFEKTYTALLYKEMSNKYPPKNIQNKRNKI